MSVVTTDASAFGAVNGVNVNTVQNTMFDFGNTFVEPEDTWFTTFFPSYYHPLVYSSKTEDISALISAQDSKLSPEEQKRRLAIVRTIMEVRYKKLSLATGYWAVIILLVTLLINLVFGASGALFTWIYVGCAVLMISGFLGGHFFAERYGKQKYVEFMQELEGKLKSGKTMLSILEDAKKEQIAQDMINAMRSTTNNRSSGISFNL